MKTVLNFLILLFVSVIYSQDIPSQKEILGLENINLVDDFKLVVTKKVPIRVIENWYIGASASEFKHQIVKLFDFDSKTFKIVASKYRFAKLYQRGYTPLVTLSYTYKNEMLDVLTTEEHNKSRYNSEYYYSPENQLFLIETKFKNSYRLVEFEYPNDSTIVKLQRDFSSDEAELSYSRTNFVLKSRLISVKRTTNSDNPDNLSVTEYEYDNNNLISQIYNYEEIINDFNQESFQTNNYIYDDSGLLKQETIRFSNENVELYDYEYIFDDYKNWIAKFKILKKDVDGLKQQKVVEIYIRNIAYSDKTVAGFKDLEDAKIINYLANKDK
jgi:hypothetical protein